MATLIAPQPRQVMFGATGNAYYADGQRRITATDASDIAALQRDGAIASLTDGEASTVSIALAAGAANVMTVTVTAQDAVGNTIAGVRELELWFSDSATSGVLTSSAYSGTLVAVTGALLTTLTAKKHFTVVTDATGVFVGSLTATAKPATEYVYVRRPIAGRAVISAASGTSWG